MSEYLVWMKREHERAVDDAPKSAAKWPRETPVEAACAFIEEFVETEMMTFGDTYDVVVHTPEGARLTVQVSLEMRGEVMDVDPPKLPEGASWDCTCPGTLDDSPRPRLAVSVHCKRHSPATAWKLPNGAALG